MTQNIHSESSLQVFVDNQIVYENDGRWLLPLFDLEEFLISQPLPINQALVRDKIIGKAAALLLIRLGVGHVHGKIMSELGHLALSQANLPHSYDRWVEQIDCKTEEILRAVDEPNEAYKILCQLAQRC
jgi:hypothetical protein